MTVVLNERGDLHQLFPEADEAFVHGIEVIVGDIAPDVITDSKIISTMLRNKNIRCKTDMDNEFLKAWRINRFTKIQEQGGMLESYEEYKSKLRQGAVDEAKRVIRASSGKRDELAAQIIHTIDDLQKSYNSAAIRLSELYSLHFPELVNDISNPVTLARMIISHPQRSSINQKMLEEYKIPSDKINRIIGSIDDSLGGTMSDTDLEPVVQYANTIIQLSSQLSTLETWIEQEMSTIAPNVVAVAGANVSARLISQFGTLEQLAMKSASKIQTTGAEKALYSALKSRGSPPKHGIIFQIPEIGNSPFWLRGKLARAYASKIAIAARLDYFKGEFLGEKYRTELRELEKELREKFPKAPERKPSEQRGPPQRKNVGRRKKNRRSRK